LAGRSHRTIASARRHDGFGFAKSRFCKSVLDPPSWPRGDHGISDLSRNAQRSRKGAQATNRGDLLLDIRIASLSRATTAYTACKTELLVRLRSLARGV
jgi:hypothetical protein